MGAIRVAPGARVRVKTLDAYGTVRDLEAVKGVKGRPRTYATVDLENGGAGRFGIPELQLV